MSTTKPLTTVTAWEKPAGKYEWAMKIRIKICWEGGDVNDEAVDHGDGLGKVCWQKMIMDRGKGEG